MIRKAKFKRTVIILGVLFSVSLIAIAAVFGVHYTDIKRYNTKKRTIEGSSSAEGVITDIRQRGQKTDSWVKNDEALGAPLNGIIYELTVSNGSKSIVKNWQLRLDIQQDCYINNAWCGEVEIHQLRNGSEKSQRLDLRNCSSGDIELEHTVSAGDILISLQPGDYIVYHHERFDGSGYPTGKKGGGIPISARIISVADAYDSMSSNRVYRSRLSKERVLNELKENRRSQFDPDIVDAFLEVLEEQERVSGDKKEKTACADSGRGYIK